jgi:hypothetical protein
MAYTFTHSVECPVEREFAWGFWAEFENWTAVDPAMESVRLDGPFAAGIKMVKQNMPEGMRRLSEAIVKASGEAGLTKTTPRTSIH